VIVFEMLTTVITMILQKVIVASFSFDCCGIHGFQVLLFQIRFHHGDQLSCGASLFRFQLTVRIDDVKTNMAFEDLGHQAVERAPGSRDELQYLSAILFLVEGFFDSINLPWSLRTRLMSFFLPSMV
jgi:hypothetical protein